MKILLFYLLYPFSFLYKTVTSIRNHLYDIGHFRSFSFQIKTISVGNLTVGGTGKTPHIEYIINLLKADRNICTLSRGYGRKTTGIVFGDNNSTATSIGDEPMQYLLKYSPQTSVVVGEERALAIPTIIHELPKTDLILLDDAFQHRPVKPGLNILLCDFNKPFYSDHLMPTGRLRESRSGAKRADVVLVSKCPDSLSDNEMRVIKSKILPYIQKDVDIFFTGVTYKEPVPIFRQHKISNHAIAISGIANPALFVANLSINYKVLNSYRLPDHHSYTLKDISAIKDLYKNQQAKNPALITTEKDMVKLIAFKEALETLPLFYIPIAVYFLKDSEKEMFDQKIRSYLDQKLE